MARVFDGAIEKAVLYQLIACHSVWADPRVAEALERFRRSDFGREALAHCGGGASAVQEVVANLDKMSRRDVHGVNNVDAINTDPARARKVTSDLHFASGCAPEVEP